MSKYNKSGVSIVRGSSFVRKIQKRIQETDQINLDGFAGFFPSPAKEHVLVSSCDGVGTKIKIPRCNSSLFNIGIDLVAMCVNDIITHGATPLFFLDYIAVPYLNEEKYMHIIRGILAGCSESNCKLLGGETAEVPDIHQSNCFDLAGFCVGSVHRKLLLPQKSLTKKGDVLIGIQSNGIHANGFSLVNQIIKDHNISLEAKCPWDNSTSFYDIFTTPTRIYYSAIHQLFSKNLIKGAAHITGGGLYENIKRSIPNHLTLVIQRKNWVVPEIFQWIQNIHKIDTEEMYQIFNMGIGFVLVIDSKDVDRCLSLIKHQCFVIGTLQ